MNRFIYAIVALVLITSLAACTLDDVTNPTSATTTTKSSTTQTTTAITTTTEGDTTGNTSDTTTTTITTTTKKTEQQTSSNVKMYVDHPNVPDYGAMLGVTHSHTASSGNENDSTGTQQMCFYYYSVPIIVQADPEAKSRVQYIDLIAEYGYKAAGTITDKQNGLTFYGYENVEEKTIVLFSATPAYIIIGVVNY